MKSIKTAISIEKPLFDEVEALAEDLKVSRSRVFALAARQFVERHKSKRLIEAINAAYQPPTEEESAVLDGMKRRFSELLEEW